MINEEVIAWARRWNCQYKDWTHDELVLELLRVERQAELMARKMRDLERELGEVRSRLYRLES